MTRITSDTHRTPQHPCTARDITTSRQTNTVGNIAYLATIGNPNPSRINTDIRLHVDFVRIYDSTSGERHSNLDVQYRSSSDGHERYPTQPKRQETNQTHGSKGRSGER
ncbi:unnamed protein product [Tilletia controversa]|nr:unnamed protein product [Tilletia controversa]